jgi:hypothetical protein
MNRSLTVTAVAVLFITPAFAGTITHTEMITPLDTVPAVTTIQTIDAPQPVSTTVVNDDGTVTHSTTHQASSESYSTSSTADGVRPYHNRAIAAPRQAYNAPATIYRSTTITQSEPDSGEIAGVMSLEDEANLTWAHSGGVIADPAWID